MKRSQPTIALGCGIVGVVGAVVTYWLVVPGLLLGLAAIVFGWRARRAHHEFGTVAITLGVVAMLLVPAVLSVAHESEEWGRDCALHPESDPNC
jgi:hypothetical protein